MDIISLPVLISKEGEWFVACCPVLDIASQGETEEEAKENIRDLIFEYMEDPDTKKPDLKTIMSASITMTNIPIKIESIYRDTKTPSPATA